jgi:hypothetical protein
MSSNITDPPDVLFPEDQIESREEHREDLPADLRDDIASTEDSLRQPRDENEDDKFEDDGRTALDQPPVTDEP